jgi:hypothetical protein
MPIWRPDTSSDGFCGAFRYESGAAMPHRRRLRADLQLPNARIVPKSVRALCRSAGCCVALCGLLPMAAFAQDASDVCTIPQLNVSKTLSDAWSSDLRRLCTELAARTDLDPDARVAITAATDHGLALRVTLSDGRTTVRHVDSSQGLALTLEALLVLPAEPPPTAAAVAAPAPPTQPTPPAATPAPAVATSIAQSSITGSQPTRRPLDEAPATRPPSPLHLGLGISAISHVAASPVYVRAGFAAHAALRFHTVFIELSPRWEAEQTSLLTSLPDFEMHEFGLLTVLGMRVWESDEGAFEVGAGALVSATTQTYRPQAAEVGGTWVDGQLAAFGRLLWSESALRWTVTIESQLSFARLASDVHIRENLPKLPSFAFGLGFGAHWESA